MTSSVTQTECASLKRQASQVQVDHRTQEMCPKGKRTQKSQTKLKTSTTECALSFLSPTAKKTEEQTEEQKFELESLSNTDKSQEPKDLHSSVLKEPLEKREENIVLNKKFTEEGQKRINDLANQGDSVDLSEPAQKQKDVTDWLNTQQALESNGTNSCKRSNE